MANIGVKEVYLGESDFDDENIYIVISDEYDEHEKVFMNDIERKCSCGVLRFNAIAFNTREKAEKYINDYNILNTDISKKHITDVKDTSCNRCHSCPNLKIFVLEM